MVKKEEEKKKKNVKAQPVKKETKGKPLKLAVKKMAVKPEKKAPVITPVKKIVLEVPLPKASPLRTEKEEKSKVKPLHPSYIYDKYDNKVQDYYGETGIVLLPRDPYWLFTYWEVSLPDIDKARQALGSGFNSSRSILRIYDVSNIIFNGSNAHASFDITLENLVKSWYISVPAPEKTWVVEIGILASSGKFTVFARSNAITTPADSMSSLDYEEWMDASESWKMYRTRSGSGSKGGIDGIYGTEGRALDASSAGVSSLSSPVKYEKKPSAFWMRVGTELIVYGATEPDARVTINNNPVRLNADGSFTTRFALTDGLHILDISGKSADGKYKKTYKIRVTQETYKEE